MSASHHEPKSAPEPPAPPRRRSSSNKQQLEASTSAAARRSSSSKVPAGSAANTSAPSAPRRSHTQSISKPQQLRPPRETSPSSPVSSGRTQPRTFDAAAPAAASQSSSPHSSGRSQPRTSSSELSEIAESTPSLRQARTARSSTSSRAHSHPPPSSSELAASTKKATSNTKFIEGDNEEKEEDNLKPVEVEESSSIMLDPDDEPLPPDDHAHRCFWRLPPQQSHSDWTLLVVAVPNGSNSPDQRHHNNDDKEDYAGAGTDAPEEIAGISVKAETTYSIHRGILAASAPRICRYFTRLFSAEPTDPTDAAQKISRMELPALAARAVPILLDYLYDPSAPLAADTSTACALHYLGNHLECPQLSWDAMQFWKRDIQYFNYHTYYQHATAFHNDKILQALARSCGQNILCIQPSSSSFVRDAAPEFWPRILNHVPHTKEASRHASKIVYQVIKAHARDMETSLFEALTDPNRLPFVDVSVASHLLDAYDYFREDEEDDNDENAGVEGIGEQSVSTPLSSLQTRCVEAIAQNWLRLATAPNNARFLSRQKPSILTELLDQVLVFADRTVAENQRIIENLKKTRRPRSSHR